MTSMKHWLLIRLAGLMAAALCSIPALAQHDLPGGGWTYDPAKDGMKDLRALKPIEGCLAPGGLVKITSTDEPGISAPYWCGKPPFCLTDAATPLGEQCTILQYARRNPRYDPDGEPGANGVRDPDDLRCVNTGLMPIAGRCPLPPELSAAINPASVQVNTNSVLTINSPHATSLSMSCTGANSAFPPYNLSNLNAYAGRTQVFDPSRAMLTGVTTCSIRATNARGNKDATVTFNATAAAPAPTVSASFNPSSPTAGGAVQLTTRTTNATRLRWSCSGRWTNQNTARAVGTITTNHTASGSAGTATCVFTATGPGGSANASASWRSVSGSGGGSGSGSGGGTELTNDTWIYLPASTFCYPYNWAYGKTYATATYSNGSITFRENFTGFKKSCVAKISGGTATCTAAIKHNGNYVQFRVDISGSSLRPGFARLVQPAGSCTPEN